MQTAASAIKSLRANGPVVVVHGGGRAIDADLKARGAEPRFVDGLRVTDEATLSTVVSVLAGRINTAFVAALGAARVKAVGLTGADASIGLSAVAPPFATTSGAIADLGLVGIPQAGAPPALVEDLLAFGYVPVIASIGVAPDGRLLNVNADTLAAHVAKAIRADRLVIAGKTAGVFDESGVTCAELSARDARAMVAAGTARDGMVAKLAACLDAIDGGVAEVRIVDGRGGSYGSAAGTTIANHQITESPNREIARC